MKFDKLSFSALFEKTLVRIISEFNSEMNSSMVSNGISKAINNKVSTNDAGSFNVKLQKLENKQYRLESAFMNYRDARLYCINLFSWIERNASTCSRCNFTVDIKFIDETPGPFKGTLFNKGITIEKIDKLKMILDFNEDRVYKVFPNRRYGFSSNSIKQFVPVQKFIPKEDSPVDPRFYTMPETHNSGINFETLNLGYLRLQYIGGTDYEKKITDILEILSEFVVSAWNCTHNSGYTKENIATFEKLVSNHNKIRESFRDYKLFKKNFPKINFTVDLMENPVTLDQFYQVIRERIFDLLVNMEIKGEVDLNYDSSVSILQLKEGTIKCNRVKNVEFVNCKIESGNLELCDFYGSEIKEAIVDKCNFFDSDVFRSKIVNSMINRDSVVVDSEFTGQHGAMNGKMTGGIFRSGGIGAYGDLDSSVVVIEYTKLKPGYWVVGDKVIIPNKKI